MPPPPRTRSAPHMTGFASRGSASTRRRRRRSSDARSSLSAAPPRRRSSVTRARRVRANAVTTQATRLDRAMAARDADALPALFANEVIAVDHMTGVTYDREGAVFSYNRLLNAKDLSCRNEPLATLGDSLALLRFS